MLGSSGEAEKRDCVFSKLFMMVLLVLAFVGSAHAVLESHGVAFTSTDEAAGVWGMAVSVKGNDIQLFNCSKGASSAATHLHIFSDEGLTNVLASAAYVGGVATLSTPLNLSANTEYFLGNNHSTNALWVNHRTLGGIPSPISGTLWDWNNGFYTGFPDQTTAIEITNCSVEVIILQIYTTHSRYSFETQNQTYSLSSREEQERAELIWNGTSHNMSTTDNHNFTIGLPTPLIGVNNTNISFLYRVYNGTDWQNTSHYNQTLYQALEIELQAHRIPSTLIDQEVIVYFNVTNKLTNSVVSNHSVFFYNTTLPASLVAVINENVSVYSATAHTNMVPSIGDIQIRALVNATHEGKTVTRLHNISRPVEQNRFYTCSAPGNYTFYLVNEETNANISGNFSATFTLSTNYYSNNFSYGLNGAIFHFCMNNTQIADLKLNAIIDYKATDFDERNYYIINSVVANGPYVIPLYLVNYSKSAYVLFQVNDYNGNKVDDAIIKIQRYYPENNTYKTVEVLKTVDGEALGHLILYTVFYKFIIEYEGRVYYNSDVAKITKTILPFSINLDTDPVAQYQETLDMSYTPIQLIGNTVYFSFSKPTGTETTVCMNVTSISSYFSNSSFCYDCTTSTAATLSCNLGNASTGNFYVKTFYQKEERNYLLDAFEIINDRRWQFLGTTGIITVMMIIGVVALAASPSPSAALFSAAFALLFCIIAGFMFYEWLALVPVVIILVVTAIKVRD